MYVPKKVDQELEGFFRVNGGLFSRGVIGKGSGHTPYSGNDVVWSFPALGTGKDANSGGEVVESSDEVESLCVCMLGLGAYLVCPGSNVGQMAGWVSRRDSKQG